MPRSEIDFWLDGYDTPEEMEEACIEYIYEALDSAGTSITRIKQIPQGEVSND